MASFHNGQCKKQTIYNAVSDNVTEERSDHQLATALMNASELVSVWLS